MQATIIPQQSTTATIAAIVAQLAAIGMDRYPAATPRLLKATAIATTRTITPQGATAGTYWVQSGTDDTAWYLVNLDGRTCTCKDHEMRQRDCCHMLAARLRKAAYQLDADYRRARDFGAPIPFVLTAKAERELDGVA